MALKIDIKGIPPYGRIIIAALPSLLLVVLLFVLVVAPKQKEIKALDSKIADLDNKIATSQKKAAALDILMKESERLQTRLKELKERLPDEREISGLLKQISDLATGSGLELKSWRPGPKKPHPSGIVSETPVAITVNGTYHEFGVFLGNLTKINRIVNIDNVQLGSPQTGKGTTILQITFNATAFSSISQADAGKKEAGK